MKRAAIVLAMATMLSTHAQSQGDVQTQGSWKRMNKAVFDWAAAQFPILSFIDALRIRSMQK